MTMDKILAELSKGCRKIERIDEKTFVVTCDGLGNTVSEVTWKYVTMADGFTHAHWKADFNVDENVPCHWDGVERIEASS